MLLAIDIGNSLTKFGVFERDTLRSRFEIPTVRRQTADEFEFPNVRSVDAVIVSTVVPELKKTYLEFARRRFNVEAVFVDSTFDFDLKIKYAQPEKLGVDRLVAAFAAAEKYGAPCVAADFGTATTIDVVSARREFLGGIIAPGMQTMSEALFLKTAQLPEIEIRRPATVIGDSTVKAIESGIYFGYIGLVDGIIERMFGELGAKPTVAATGGFASLIAESSRHIKTIDENLMLEGLRRLYARLANR